MATVRVANGETELWVEERGEGPALLLLNGLSQSTANWRSQMRALAGDYRVIAYDARGQGRSALGPVPIRLEDQVADLEGLLDALGVERVTLVGFSHGARVALAAASALPERVERLVLTSVGTNDGPHRRLIVRSWREVLVRGGVEAMAWCTLPMIVGEEFARAHRGQVDGIIRATVQRNSPEGLEALLTALEGYPDPTAEARRVRAPVLLLTSDRDPLVPLEDARRLADAFDTVEHVLIRGCGHTLPIEAPEAWREAVVQFLRRHAEG
ncbi:MAG: alpha/beta fold hydrolase [Deltaproteobacteria bacterium]|nr:MAG: alpha/beta fold hydrolase [Deltaproteobacteria bacterium]